MVYAMSGKVARRQIQSAGSVIKSDLIVSPEPGYYAVNEIFHSIQGEGAQAGTGMIFLRFSECNLRCTVKNAGFDCDTEFSSARQLDLTSLMQEVQRYKNQWILLTGGEPALQVSGELIEALHSLNLKIAIETNGTLSLPPGIDWVSVSPKSAEHTLKQKSANEVRYVRRHGMALPSTTVTADHRFISPAFQADGKVLREDLDWCIDLVKNSGGQWKLSVQLHKLLHIR